jgi:hypothetical protein
MRHYTVEEIEAQRKQTATVEKLGGHADYQLEYAFLQYLMTGTVPTVDDYAQEIDKKAASDYIEERTS